MPIWVHGKYSNTRSTYLCARTEPCTYCWRCKNYSTRDYKCLECYPVDNRCKCTPKHRENVWMITKMLQRQSFHPDDPKQMVGMAELEKMMRKYRGMKDVEFGPDWDAMEVTEEEVK